MWWSHKGTVTWVYSAAGEVSLAGEQNENQSTLQSTAASLDPCCCVQSSYLNKHLETFKCVTVSAQLRFSGGQSHLSKSCSSALVNFMFLLQLKDLQSSLDLVLSSCQHYKTTCYLASKKSTHCFCRWGDVCLSVCLSFFMNDTFLKIINGSGLLLEICWWFMFCLNASILEHSQTGERRHKPLPRQTGGAGSVLTC